ncbi:hypothetical protein [Mycobacteroides abscessus]|uniref:hypothetical protein n=1 Tax=Mycobacteroides abscessus TaxID=36809 RepID=UPI0005B38530|nr:hypothetical protein [Mycobacteroides abscessus]
MTDFPQPLRLAKGSHRPGSGRGCAMNVVSYTNGDTVITDYPKCSARPLASLVQMVNDLLAGDDGFLSPENSVIALNLGWRTVGTANTLYGLHTEWWKELTGQEIHLVYWKTSHMPEEAEKYLTEIFFYGHSYPDWNTEGLIAFANRAIDKWIELMPIAPAEPITQAQIEYAMDRIGQ